VPGWRRPCPWRGGSGQAPPLFVLSRLLRAEALPGPLPGAVGPGVRDRRALCALGVLSLLFSPRAVPAGCWRAPRRSQGRGAAAPALLTPTSPLGPALPPQVAFPTPTKYRGASARGGHWRPPSLGSRAACPFAGWERVVGGSCRRIPGSNVLALT